VPDNLLESELFGYKSGAFTDAKKDKLGKIALAEKGTLFLDEIGEISPAIQAKLLRFIQEREYEPLGGLNPVKSNVRIIAATNKNLSDEVKKGLFREDLFYRLNVINIKLPPLSARREDIPLLISHFIKKFNYIKGKNIEGVTDEVMNILMNYNFPGNVRELENIIEHAFVLCREAYINTKHLPQYLRAIEDTLTGSENLEEMEKIYIAKALSKFNGNKLKTAQALGINSSTLWRKMKKYNME